MATVPNPINLNLPETPQGLSEPTYTRFLEVYNAIQQLRKAFESLPLDSILPVDVSTDEIEGILKSEAFPALVGDVTTSEGSVVSTLATVNEDVGTFTNATVTTNAKGLVLAVDSGPVAETVAIVPYFIAPTETFTVPLYKQMLFEMLIDNEGTLDIDGYLIEVD